MRTLLRNKSKFYYASYIGETEIIDEYGNATGEYKVEYSNPIEAFGNISAAQGEMQSRQFGDSESYDKVIVLDDRNAPIDEHSILWVDTLPHLISAVTDDTNLILKGASVEDENAIMGENATVTENNLTLVGLTTDTPHDYIVRKCARSLNGVSIAIRKVSVDA